MEHPEYPDWIIKTRLLMGGFPLLLFVPGRLECALGPGSQNTRGRPLNRPLSMLQITGILLLFAVWIGGWTLVITVPQFAALQKTGIQNGCGKISSR